MRAARYGDYDMQANGCVVTATDVFSPPAKIIQADKLAERDGALVVKQQWDSKTFTVEGYLRADTPLQLDILMDAFKEAMGRRNQPFDVGYGTGLRRFLASAQNIVITSDGLTRAAFSVQFLSPDGMGWDLASSVLFAPTGITQSVASIPFTVGGTYKAEPIIRVVINTITGGANKTLTLGNAATLRSISITRSFAAGDIIEYNTLSGSLQVNSAVVPYRGKLLSFETGSQSLTWNDDFTARDVTISGSYTKRHL